MSWWRVPRLSRDEVRYIKSIESVFRVKDAAKRWVRYDLQPHQIDFHCSDVALKGCEAKSRVVVKSRNTSFTTSALVSNLMAVPFYPSQDVPFVRLNETRAFDLIDECKELIRNMKPLVVGGVCFPFDSRDCDLDAAGRIRFPNGVVFKAYPANAAAAENIRGLRIGGSAGMLDECFTGGMRVKLRVGSKRIEDVVVGDEVLSFNELNKKFEFKKVSGVLEKPKKKRNILCVWLKGNRGCIECTLEHPFYKKNLGYVNNILCGESDREFVVVEAKDLVVGDCLVCDVGGGFYEDIEIVKIGLKELECSVFNLDVEGNHNFFVGSGYDKVFNVVSVDLVDGELVSSGDVWFEDFVLVHNCNFMPTFDDIYISLRDAASGFTVDGEKHFQINMGSTLKSATTPFALWFRKQEELVDSDMSIFRWEVFDPSVFDIERPPLEQPGLVPLVPWHNIVDLNKKYLEDSKTFLEEYMAVLVDSDSQFYSGVLFDGCVDGGLKNVEVPTESNVVDGRFVMGVDVASAIDFFVVSVFRVEQREVEVRGVDSYGETTTSIETQSFYTQVGLFYDRGRDLKEMEEILKEKIDLWLPFGLEKVRIDSQGVGLQLFQNVRKAYGKRAPGLVESVPLNRVRRGSESVRMKEFLHTNLKKLMVYGNVKFLKDEMQRVHFGMWDYDFNCVRTKEFGHGDTVVAAGYALLPDNFRGKRVIKDILMAFEPGTKNNKSLDDLSVKEVIEAYNALSFKDRVEEMRKNK